MEKEIGKALEALKSGELILYPTDTIWGIGCDATNPQAVEKIHALKRSNSSKSMIVLMENPNMLLQYVEEVPELAWDLLELSESPLTIIYPQGKNLATNLFAPDGSVGIRIVKHAFAERLIRSFKKPIVSTSANFSGNPYPTHFGEIEHAIAEGVTHVVSEEFDVGATSKPSGIIQLGVNGTVKVIRE